MLVGKGYTSRQFCNFGVGMEMVHWEGCCGSQQELRRRARHHGAPNEAGFWRRWNAALSGPTSCRISYEPWSPTVTPSKALWTIARNCQLTTGSSSAAQDPEVSLRNFARAQRVGPGARMPRLLTPHARKKRWRRTPFDYLDEFTAGDSTSMRTHVIELREAQKPGADE